jgi:hypothetical protein
MKVALTLELDNLRYLEGELGKNLDDLRKDFPFLKIRQDPVTYGVQESLILGLVFVYQAAASGFTWDMIKLHGQLLANWLMKAVAAKQAAKQNVCTSIEVRLSHPNLDLGLLIKGADPHAVSDAFKKVELAWEEVTSKSQTNSRRRISLVFENGTFKEYGAG